MTERCRPAGIVLRSMGLVLHNSIITSGKKQRAEGIQHQTANGNEPQVWSCGIRQYYEASGIIIVGAPPPKMMK